MPGRIEKKKLAFRCYRAECVNEPPTEVFVDVPQGKVLSGREREITRYCRRNHVNQLTVPAEWDSQGAILSTGEIVERLVGGTPVVQGRRP